MKKISLSLLIITFVWFALSCTDNSMPKDTDMNASPGHSLADDTQLESTADQMEEDPLIPRFICTPDSGGAPLRVSLDASPSSGSINDYSWTFGDGQLGAGKQAEHIFQNPGSYAVVLTVSGNAGFASESLSISVLPSDMIGLYDSIEAYRMANYPETEVAFWAESSEYGSVSYNADQVWPTASTIKVFILIAAYIQYEDVWNEIPPELASILNYEQGFTEPLRMFDAPGRESVQAKLSNMSYRELAVSMMGVNQEQIGNSAYNAACNVFLFLLGGVDGGCTEKIHAISPEFNSVRIGRYMLEDRTPENENQNSMRSIAAACKLIYDCSIPGLDTADCNAIRDCFQKVSFLGFNNYQKRGHLSTTPSLTAWIGWIEKEDQFLFYGVNVLYPTGISLEERGADHYRDIIRSTLTDL
jgi:PKD repeat protein